MFVGKDNVYMPTVQSVSQSAIPTLRFYNKHDLVLRFRNAAMTKKDISYENCTIVSSTKALLNVVCKTYPLFRR